jgi:hypothetical protein
LKDHHLRLAGQPAAASDDRRLARDRQIVARRAAGARLAEIGAEFGLTRERVRQIIAEHGGPSRRTVAQFAAERAEQARLELRERALSVLDTQPGVSLAELSEALGERPAAVRAALGADARRLLRHSKARIGRVDSDELLEGLRLAAELTDGPLTGTAYDRIESMLGLQSRVRIVQRFGTWVSACELAGVTPGRAVRDNYRRSWTKEEMLDWVIAYLGDPRSPGTYAGYGAFARVTDGAPSATTLRNELGTWADIKSAALRRAAERGLAVC